ncbi:hypothetical protein LY76DRAFT_673802 [Colletotrichum caudatum]|nr:hypothetical protein LY76DRAFT_673802 [Colletotrichum caudatum]
MPTEVFDKLTYAHDDDGGEKDKDDQEPDDGHDRDMTIPVTPAADVLTGVEAVTALTGELAISSSPDAAQDSSVPPLPPRHIKANAASLTPAASPLNLPQPPPHAIVTPPPALAPLPAEYYVFARARSQRGLARRRLDEANKEDTRARDAYKEGERGVQRGFQGLWSRRPQQHHQHKQ